MAGITRNWLNLVIKPQPAMATIQIEVSDELVAKYGAKAIQEKFEKDLRWESLRQKALALKAALDEAGLDHDEIMKEAKKRAWDKYKYTIKDKLPPEAFD